MYKIDKKQLKDSLKDRLNYSDKDADFYISAYPEELNEKLGAALEKWMYTGEIQNVEHDGVSLTKIIEVHDTNFPTAVRELNDLFVIDRQKESMIYLLTHPHIIE